MAGKGFYTVAAAARSVDGRHSWRDRIAGFPRMLSAVLNGSWRGNRFALLASALGLLYVISPIDFIPELILGPLGIADDFAMAAVSLAFLVKAVDGFLDTPVEEASARKESNSRVWVERDGATGETHDVIDGEIIS